jgi:hypothetical protein
MSQCFGLDMDARPSEILGHSRRAILTKQQAREIFGYKNGQGSESSHATSTFLSKKFNISSKAIRDIWTGRSWLDATFDMWNIDDRPPRKVVGRPKGRKDTKPRKCKSALENVDFEIRHNLHGTLSAVSVSEHKVGNERENDIVREQCEHRQSGQCSAASVQLPSINSVKARCFATMQENHFLPRSYTGQSMDLLFKPASLFSGQSYQPGAGAWILEDELQYDASPALPRLFELEAEGRAAGA